MCCAGEAQGTPSHLSVFESKVSGVRWGLPQTGIIVCCLLLTVVPGGFSAKFWITPVQA